MDIGKRVRDALFLALLKIDAIRRIRSINYAGSVIISLRLTGRPGQYESKLTLNWHLQRNLISFNCKKKIKKFVKRISNKKILFSAYCRCIADLSLSRPAIPRKLRWKAIRFMNIPMGMIKFMNNILENDF